MSKYLKLEFPKHEGTSGKVQHETQYNKKYLVIKIDEMNFGFVLEYLTEEAVVFNILRQ